MRYATRQPRASLARLAILLALTLATLLAMAHAMAAQAATPLVYAELSAELQAGASQITLGDVASYISGDARLWQALAAESLCLAPQRGSAISLSAQDILGLLAKRGYDWRAIGLSGASAVRISCATQTVDGRAITALLETACQEHLGTGVKLEMLKDIPAQQLPAGDVQISVRFPNKPGWWLPEAVEFQSQGRLIAAIPLSNYVRFTLSVLTAPTGIAARTLVAAERLGSADVTLPAGSEVITQPLQVLGLTTRGALAAGQRLKFSRLAAPFDVRRGEQVALLIESGGVSLRAQALALNDAYIGQSLAVTRTDDGVKYTGLVCAGPTVVVK